MEPFRAIRSHLEIFGAIWSHLEPFGAIWSHLEPFAALWSYLEPVVAISSQLEPLPTILKKRLSYSKDKTVYICNYQCCKCNFESGGMESIEEHITAEHEKIIAKGLGFSMTLRLGVFIISCLFQVNTLGVCFKFLGQSRGLPWWVFKYPFCSRRLPLGMFVIFLLFHNNNL